MNKLKKTAALLLLCLSVFAVSASSAAATPTGGLYMSEGQFHAENYPLNFGGQQIGKHEFYFGGGNIFSCETVEMVGVHSQASGTLNLYGGEIANCKTIGGNKVIAEANTCDFAFGIGGQLGWNECDNSSEFLLPGLRFKRYNGAGELACSIRAANGINAESSPSVTYSNYGSGSSRGVEASIYVYGLPYQAKGPECGKAAGSQTNGQWLGKMKFQALSLFWG